MEKVIAVRKAAFFFQINRRLQALMDLQVSSKIPLLLQLPSCVKHHWASAMPPDVRRGSASFSSPLFSSNVT
jgi:hypothetical protein